MKNGPRIYKTLFEAMTALANKKNQLYWHIEQNDNGWFFLKKN